MRPNGVYAAVLGLLVLALVAQIDAIEDKCGACRAVAVWRHHPKALPSELISAHVPIALLYILCCHGMT